MTTRRGFFEMLVGSAAVTAAGVAIGRVAERVPLSGRMAGAWKRFYAEASQPRKEYICQPVFMLHITPEQAETAPEGVYRVWEPVMASVYHADEDRFEQEMVQHCIRVCSGDGRPCRANSSDRADGKRVIRFWEYPGVEIFDIMTRVA